MKDKLFRTQIDAPVERVWKELTKTDEVQGAVFNAWLVTTAMAEGAPLQMRTGSGKNVMAEGRVLVHEPNVHFAHTYRLTRYHDTACELHYLLAAKNGGTELTLRVKDCVEDTPTERSLAVGGDFILKNLKQLAEGKGLPLGTRFLYLVMGAMEFVLPKRCRTENWPLA